MSALSNTWVMSLVGMFLLIVLCYISGRLHQWYKHGLDREDAYRDGYNTATRSLFSLATRASAIAIARTTPTDYRPGIVRGAAPVESKSEPVSGTAAPRHRAEDRRRRIPPPSPNKYAFPELQDRQSA